jgi:hypothetical protein
VEVQVTAENEDVAKIIRGGSKELENSLKDHNLSLAKFDVHVSSDAPLVAIDTKTSLSDQFMPQQQQHNHPQGGFAQAGNESNGRFNQWGSSQQQQQHRQSSSEFMAEDNQRSMAQRPGSRAKPRDNSRRLDVVA